MYLTSVILLLCSFSAGLAVLALPKLGEKNFKNILSFSGAYLFSITVIHILPEIFESSTSHLQIGIWVLVGFFFQLVLEFFSEGVEHGHIHSHGHDHGKLPLTLLVSLGIHSFLEGTLLVHPESIHAHHDADTLLFGMVMHKMPEAFALMAVLMSGLQHRLKAILVLFVFSLTTPAGMWLSEFIFHNGLVNKQVFTALFAVVAGNFLHISTTIFFESSPNHHFKANKLLLSIGGASLAVLAELFL